MKNGAAIAAPITSPKRALPCGLDVIPTAAAATAERGITSAVRVAHRITDNAAEAGVHLKAGNLVTKSLNLVRLNQRASGFALGMDRRSDVASVLVHLRGQVCRGEPVVAAALRELRGQVASLRGDGVIKRERAVADAIADVVQTVIELAELLAEQNLLLAGGSCILTKFALAVAPAVAVEAPEEKKQNEPNCTIAAPSVITAIDSSAEIRKTVIIQNNHSFQFI
jgi:hypothetical protein